MKSNDFFNCFLSTLFLFSAKPNQKTHKNCILQHKSVNFSAPRGGLALAAGLSTSQRVYFLRSSCSLIRHIGSISNEKVSLKCRQKVFELESVFHLDSTQVEKKSSGFDSSEEEEDCDVDFFKVGVKVVKSSHKCLDSVEDFVFEQVKLQEERRLEARERLKAAFTCQS